MSLEDRRENVFRSKFNHYSYHGIGSIVLLVTGFDCLLNEVVAYLPSTERDLADQSLLKKYSGLLTVLGVSHGVTDRDLDLLVDVRHEIVHYLPRPISSSSGVPEWFQELQDRGLFITASHSSGSDFALGWKLGSYRLCYWSW